MLLSERSKGSLMRKPKPISFSQVLKKSLAVSILPPLNITPAIRDQQQKQPVKKQQVTQPQERQFQFFRDQKHVASFIKNELSNFTNHKRILTQPARCFTETERMNKECQTTFDEELLLEYLNT